MSKKLYLDLECLEVTTALQTAKKHPTLFVCNEPRLRKKMKGRLRLKGLYRTFVEGISWALRELSEPSSGGRHTRKFGPSVQLDFGACNRKRCLEESSVHALRRQCAHATPAVTMTKVGVGLNIILRAEERDLLFTVDLVPSLELNVKSDFNGLSLRQVWNNCRSSDE